MPERRAFSVSVFARHHERVLLIRHKRLETWLPVGGEIEAGETPLEAARRELHEETGLEGNFAPLNGVEGTPPGLIGYEEHPAGSKGLHLNFAFVADVASDKVVPPESFGIEFDDHRWVADTTGVDCPGNVRELVELALAPAAGAAPPLAATRLAALARDWVAAFNARDLERLLAFYADEAVHASPKLRARRPETKGLVRGKPALRDWFADSFARLPGLHYETRAISTGADRVVLEYQRTNPGDEPLAVAEIFVVRADRIVESHVFHG